MNPLDLEMLVDQWTGLGFQATTRSGNRRVAADLCVYATFAARPRHPCEWLDIDVECSTATLRPTQRKMEHARG